LSASAFYPFCPHPHFILFVRIRILSLLSASAFYPFFPSVRPHPHFIPTRSISLSSAEVSVLFRLRVFHTAVQYGKRHVKRHVKLIETSAEERGSFSILEHLEHCSGTIRNGVHTVFWNSV
jgi:hypothetical protein